MATMDTTEIAPLYTRDTSVITGGKASMRHSKVLVVLLVVILFRGVVPAQVRESGRIEVQANRPQAGQAGIASTVAQSSLTRDSFSTNVTGAQVALGPGDLLEITVFD